MSDWLRDRHFDRSGYSVRFHRSAADYIGTISGGIGLHIAQVPLPRLTTTFKVRLQLATMVLARSASYIRDLTKRLDLLCVSVPLGNV